VGMNFNFNVKRFFQRAKKIRFLYRASEIFLLLFFFPLFSGWYSGLIYFGEDFMFEEFLYSSVADDV
jgi:hypothetical protein